MINFKQVYKSYRGDDVLNDISFTLNPKDKVAVVGPNGCGKSTLLKIVARIEKPDRGNVEYIGTVHVGYLPQEISLNEIDETVENYLKEISGISKIERRMAELEQKLGKDETNNEYFELQQEFSSIDGYNFSRRMKKILAGLGLTGYENRKISELSGGQRTKIALADVILKGVDVLLLDEPTNNLDLPSIIWLENYLAKSKAACLFVSHDRRFLDRMVKKIYEIDWFSRKITEYPGNYSNYVKTKNQRMTAEQEQYDRQMEEIARLKTSAQEKRKWSNVGSKQETRDNDKFIRGARRDRAAKAAARATAITQQLENIEVITPIKKREPTILALSPKVPGGDVAVTLTEAVLGYKGGFILQPISLQIAHGERIAIVGRNGTGKSTILKAIVGDLKPFSGTIVLGPSVIIGSMMQHHEGLDWDKPILETLHQKTGCKDQEAYKALANFNFLPLEAATKKISELSPGERARILLAIFSLRSANLLILDEPTNHLDIDALDALEKVLKTYKGTVILVSHDRYFLEIFKMDRIFCLDHGKLQQIFDYESYLKSQKMNEL